MIPLFFFFSLTLLCPFPLFGFHFPCCDLIFFLRTYRAMALFFSSNLPCCALIFLRTYPAVPLSRFSLPLTLLCLYFFFFRTPLFWAYPAFRFPLSLLCLVFFALFLLCF